MADDAPEMDDVRRRSRHVEGQTIAKELGRLVHAYFASNNLHPVEAAYVLQAMLPQLVANLLCNLAAVMEDPGLAEEVLEHVTDNLIAEAEGLTAAIEQAARGDAVQH